MQMLNILFLTVLALHRLACLEFTSSAVPFVRTNIFTKSQSKNALYAVGLTNFRVYRMNYTRNLLTTTLNFASGHSKLVNAIAVSLGEKYIVTGGSDYRVIVTETFTQQRICTFVNLNQVKALVFHPLYEEIVYSASLNDMIRKWNISTCKKLAERNISASISSLDFSLDGTRLYYGTF